MGVQGSRAVVFGASQLFASASQSTLAIIPGAPSAVGDWQYAVASLLSTTRWPVTVADNALVTVTGAADTGRMPKPCSFAL